MLTTKRLFTSILFLALFVMSTREIADPDFWWHLRTGQYIIETGAVPHADIFSFTNAGAPWIAHEWLSEVFIFAIYRVGGFPALILTFSLIITLAFAFVYSLCAGKPYLASFVLLLTALATAPTWGVRPQMISLLLTSIFLFILDKSSRAQGDPKPGDHKGRPYIWLLVPLMLLWVNLHSGYALGIAIVGVYFLGEVIAILFQSRDDAHKALHDGTRNTQYAIRITPHASRLFLLLALCLAIVPLNPNGATMYVYPFETLTSRTMQTYIQEWFSPDFHLPEFQPFAFLLLATFASFAISRRRAHPRDLLLLAGFGYAALRSARHIPLFALIAAPILAANVWDWLSARGWSKSLEPRAQTRRSAIALNWLILILVAGAGALRVVSVISNQATVERAKFPAAAVDFLQKNNLTAPLYNAYGWGGYLIWREFPAARVFIDGRADVYGDRFIEEFLRTYRGGADWRTPLEHYGVRLILVEPDAPIVTPLAQDAAWQKLYADAMAVIYEKK